PAADARATIATTPPALHPVSLCFATIVAPNYFAYARVLAESIARWRPDAQLRVLVVSRPDPADAALAQGLQLVYSTALGPPDFEQIAYKYDVVELNTALKPSFLKRLFAEGFGQVVYLDPDIRLHAPLEPLTEALATAQIVLIPHSQAPVMDGARPSDIDFLR